MNFGCRREGLAPELGLLVIGAIGVVTTGIVVFPNATTLDWNCRGKKRLERSKFDLNFWQHVADVS